MSQIINDWARSLIGSTGNKASTVDINALINQLAVDIYKVEYTKVNNEKVEMFITLRSDVTGKIMDRTEILSSFVKNETISVYSTDRDGWRSLKAANIKLIRKHPNTTVSKAMAQANQKVVTEPEPTSAKVTSSTTAFSLSIAQQTAIFFWIKTMVHPALKARNLNNDINVHFINDVDGGVIRVVENNSGLMLDL